MRKSGERSPGGFGQTVCLQDVNAERVKVVTDLRIEARASGDQIAHSLAEGTVQFAEEDTPSVESDNPQTTVKRH